MGSGEHLHRVRAYGLNIQSALPLPGLLSAGEAGNQTSDIVVRLTPITGARKPVAVDDDHLFWADDGRACHILKGVGAFLVREGREIVVESDPHAPDELLRISLLGPALALALHQRGCYVFHASAVGIGELGVAFLGGFAAGKSTMAAAMIHSGHLFMSDDVTAVTPDGPSPQIVPSFPQLKLWPDAAGHLGLQPEKLPKVHPDREKRMLQVDRTFATSPRPLRRLYVLAVGESVAIQPLSPVESFEAILRYWYGSRFGPTYLEAIDLPALVSASRLADPRGSREAAVQASHTGRGFGASASHRARDTL